MNPNTILLIVQTAAAAAGAVPALVADLQNLFKKYPDVNVEIATLESSALRDAQATRELVDAWLATHPGA